MGVLGPTLGKLLRGTVGSLGLPRSSTDTGTVVDLFIVTGQSNGVGQGTSGPDATATGYYFNGTSFSALADPVGNANTGSMWPAFANEWFVQTARKSVWVAAAVGSTRLLDYGMLPSDTWAPTGSLRGAAAVAAQNAVAAIRADASFALGNVYFVWVQGEGDAENLDGSHTAAQYEQALEDLATYFLGMVPQMTQMVVVRSALNINDATKDLGYSQIRAAQESACTDSSLLTMACRSSYSFRTLGYIATNVHYIQPGLNICGKVAARGLNSPESFSATAAIPAPVAYTDTDYATATGSVTLAHTTNASAKFLAVAAVAMRPGSNTTFTITGITFNGVAMTQARVQADNGTTAGRAVSAIYYLDEATYGGSLSGVTANIVVTCDSAAVNLFEVVAFNATERLYPDYAISTNASTDSQTALPLDFYTGAPALTIAAVGSCGPGAAAATCTWTNMTTEVLDAGGSNGTRIGQGSIAYSQDAAVYGPRTITPTFSGNQNAIALCVASFRKPWNGE